MTFDEYNRAVTQVHNELLRIAQRTEQQAFSGGADTASSEFAALMQRHAELIKLSTQLTERLIGAMKAAK